MRVVCVVSVSQQQAQILYLYGWFCPIAGIIIEVPCTNGRILTSGVHDFLALNSFCCVLACENGRQLILLGSAWEKEVRSRDGQIGFDLKKTPPPPPLTTTAATTTTTAQHNVYTVPLWQRAVSRLRYLVERLCCDCIGFQAVIGLTNSPANAQRSKHVKEELLLLGC